jgi:transcriptional regulator with XRE-family HTH domain
MFIGQKIKKLRELKNLTQDYMANQLGLSQSAYSKMENGEVDIPFTRIEEIAKIFTIRPEDIITFNENTIFNLYNNQTATGYVINHNYDAERKLYEEQRAADKEQIEYLKNIINQLMNNKG